MPAQLRGDKAELVALWVETLLYGIYAVYFQQSFAFLTYQRTAPRIQWLLIFVSIGIFALATAHLFIVFTRVIQAFTEFPTEKGGAVAYFNNLQSGLEVSQASCQIVISFLGDGMAIYRVWVVYNRKLIVILLPLLSLAGTTVASVASVIVIGQTSSPNTVFYVPKLKKWLPIFFGLTFCTSVMCTLMIAARLWYVASTVSQTSATRPVTKHIQTIQRIIIESASLYSGTMLIYLTTYMAESNYNIIFGDMVSPVIGLAFSLITIRVHNTFREGVETTLTTTGRLTEPSQWRSAAFTSGRSTSLNPNFTVSGTTSDLEKGDRHQKAEEPDHRPITLEVPQPRHLRRSIDAQRIGSEGPILPGPGSVHDSV